MTLSLKGTITLGSGCVTSCDTAGSLSTGDQTIQNLFGGCTSGKVYQSVVQASVALSTAGVPGQNFVSVDALDQLAAVEFLWLKCDQRCVIRVGAASPVSITANSFPITVGSTSALAIDYTVPVTGLVSTSTSFAAGSYTAAQSAALINSTAALNGLPTPVAVVDSSGNIKLTGVGTGFASSVAISGAMASILTFSPATANGAGSDVPVFGTFLCEFGAYGSIPAVPSKIQLSGTGTVSLIAAGRSIV